MTFKSLRCSLTTPSLSQQTNKPTSISLQSTTSGEKKPSLLFLFSWKCKIEKQDRCTKSIYVDSCSNLENILWICYLEKWKTITNSQNYIITSYLWSTGQPVKLLIYLLLRSSMSWYALCKCYSLIPALKNLMSLSK